MSSLARRFVERTPMCYQLADGYRRWLAFRGDHNARYDLLTIGIMRRILRKDSNCVDVGASSGTLLYHMVRLAPLGRHMAFEPLPEYYRLLRRKFANKNVAVSDLALSDSAGVSEFNHVVNRPGYSGLRERSYVRLRDPAIEKMAVRTERLDGIYPEGADLGFLKIDVEGGEYGVIKGAARTIRRGGPTVVFEFGMGGADCYGVTPPMMYSLLRACGLRVSTLQGYPDSSLSGEEFADRYNTTDFMFAGFP